MDGVKEEINQKGRIITDRINESRLVFGLLVKIRTSYKKALGGVRRK